MPQKIHATDLYSLTQCDRQVYLDHHGDRSLRAAPDPYQSWLREQGRRHETQVIEQFKVETPPYTYDNLEIGFEITLGLMKEGVPHIYQGVLIHGDMVGIPDLLERVDGPSTLGGWHYRPLDIKSASKSSEGHRLQVMAYCALLERLQGVRPDGALLLNLPLEERSEGNLYQSEPVEFDEALYRAKLSEALLLADGREPKPFLSSACASCAWREVCTPMVEQAGDASLIPGLRRDVWRTLHLRGLGTLAALAASSVDEIIEIKGVGEKTAPQLIQRARSLSSGEVIILSLPELPPAGCIVFDVESAPSQGVYYLMGTLSGDDYEVDLAESPQDEGHMWWNFLGRMKSTTGPIAHYGNYERQTVNKLAERHGGADEAAALLERMVDLEKLLKEAAILPLRSYSLKAVAPWMGFSWNSAVEGGADSILEYIRWLEDGDRAHLARITDYNSEDCRATRVVLEWLHRLAAQETG
jgi:predicted RecB family nuclease